MLETIVFISGAVVMMLEVTGARILAPYVGTSTAIWTSIIGVILASLSVGYAWGGRLADSRPTKRTLSFLLLCAAFSLAIVVLIKNPFLAFLRTLFGSDIRAISLVGTTVLFGIPSTLLGTISPYSAKLKIHSLKSTGRTLGNLYALSTAGSIGGTFLTGFVLLNYLGNTEIVTLLSMLLLICAWIAGLRPERVMTAVVLAVLIGCAVVGNRLPVSPNEHIVATIDTAYNSLWIYETVDPTTKKHLRAMVTDPFSAQSGIYLEDTSLAFGYTKAYDVITARFPDIQNALMIGGGAFTYPSYFVDKYNAPMDAVEIDPRLTQVAKRYFRLTDNGLLEIINQDGRAYLNTNTKQYDLIYIDAYNSFIPPYHLTTRETVSHIKRGLTDRGAVLANIISPIKGRNEFFRAVYKTYLTSFRYVTAIRIVPNSNPEANQNILIVASGSRDTSLRLTSDLNKSKFEAIDMPPTDTIPELTDEFNPIEHYMQNLY